MNNRKGSGFFDATIFLLVALLIVIIVGFYDLAKVEYYEPISDKIKDLAIERIDETHPDYLAMLEIDNTVNTTVFPFNLLFIGLSLTFFFFSMYKAIFTPRSSAFILFTRTTGGLIVTLYLVSILLMQIINWFTEIFLDYLFADVIINFVPSYIFVQDNWGAIIVVWVLAYYMLNYFFGSETQYPDY